MSLLAWIIIGGISGWLASKVVGEDQNMGIVANIVVGIIGAFVAGTLLVLIQTGTLDLTGAINGFNFTSLIISFVGAVILLYAMKLFKKNS